MKLEQILQILGEVAQQRGIGTPYIVGGIPRNILLEILTNLNDVDITTGDEDVHRLADAFAARLGVQAKILKDGHKKVIYEGISFDFSSNFKYPNIDEILNSMGINNVTGLVRETYSRDFTVNTLLTPLDFSEIIDITGKGVADVNNRELRCPVSCDAAFRASPIRMIRAFYYSARYDLSIPGNMRRSIQNNLNLLDDVDKQYKAEKISAVLRAKPGLLEDLIELGVMQKIPMTREITKLLVEKKRLKEVL